MSAVEKTLLLIGCLTVVVLIGRAFDLVLSSYERTKRFRR